MRLIIYSSVMILARNLVTAAPEMIGGTCSGFFVDETHVVTCGHCVPKDASFEIIHANTRAPAAVAFVDTNLDIAVLTCTMPTTKALQLGDSDSLQLLDDLYVFGFPLASTLGLELSASQGKLNARRSVFGKNWLQLDAVVNPGNSGGPVVNKRGQVVGIAVAKLAPLTMTQSLRVLPERINFAIPSSTLRGRLLQGQISFSFSAVPGQPSDDVFATVREATVLVSIKPGEPPPPLLAPGPKRASNVVINVIMAKDIGGKPTTTFPADFPKVFALFRTKGAKTGDKLRGVWIADDVGDAAPKGTTIDERTLTAEGDTDDGMFSLSKPTDGWPVGKYKLEIYVNDQLNTTVKFAIEGGKSTKKDAAAGDEGE
jgi:hypothetical protein